MAGPAGTRESPKPFSASHSLHRKVELSRCAANTFQHRTAYAILSHMAAALISKSVVKQALSRSIPSSRAHAVTPRWTVLEKCCNISAIFFEGVSGVLFPGRV